MGIRTGGLVVYKLPGLARDIVGDNTMAMVNSAAKDFVCADVF